MTIEDVKKIVMEIARNQGYKNILYKEEHEDIEKITLVSYGAYQMFLEAAKIINTEEGQLTSTKINLDREATLTVYKL